MVLVLDIDDYRTVTKYSKATIKQLTNPVPVNKSITSFSMPFKTLALQKSKKVRKAAYELQEAVTDIVLNRSLSALKKIMSENATRNTSASPTVPSTPFSHIYKRHGER